MLYRPFIPPLRQLHGRANVKWLSWEGRLVGCVTSSAGFRPGGRSPAVCPLLILRRVETRGNHTKHSRNINTSAFSQTFRLIISTLQSQVFCYWEPFDSLAPLLLSTFNIALPQRLLHIPLSLVTKIFWHWLQSSSWRPCHTSQPLYIQKEIYFGVSEMKTGCGCEMTLMIG